MATDIQPTSSQRDGRRQRQKRETYARILSAARDLFALQGFEPTTIKQIADASDVAAGTVITHFGSKAELLMVLLDDLNERQLNFVHSTLPEGGQVLDRLCHVFGVYYRFDLEQPSLASAVLSYSWVWPEQTERRMRAKFAPGDELVRSILRTGIDKGEIKPDANLPLAASMMFALYTRTMRAGIFDHATPDQCLDILRPQLSLIVDGLKP
ncbi:MAG: TetR/AcrR family transcriptional regulator [Geminicoccaceae bacterium]